MVLYEARKCILRVSWPTQNALSHTTFSNYFKSLFLLKIFLISYYSRPQTQNLSASKAESYIKLRLEGLSRKPHPCIGTKALLSLKFHKVNHPHNSNKRDFRTASQTSQVHTIFLELFTPSNTLFKIALLLFSSK